MELLPKFHQKMVAKLDRTIILRSKKIIVERVQL